MPRKSKIKTIDWLIKNYLSFFNDFALSENYIRDYFEEWKINNRDRIEDYIWHLFNLLLSENAYNAKDLYSFYKKNDSIYTQMLYFRRKYENNSANEIKRLIDKNKIDLYNEDSKYELEVFIITTKDCKACIGLESQVFSIEEASQGDIIPYDKCDRYIGCTCSYSIKAKKNSNGRLIRK